MCVCVYWGRGFLPRVAGRRGAIQLGAGPAPWVAVACYRNRDPEASSAAVRAGNPGLVGAGSRARRSRPDAGLPQVVDVLFSGCADRACVGGCTLVDKRGQGFLRGPTQVEPKKRGAPSQARLVLRLHPRRACSAPRVCVGSPAAARRVPPCPHKRARLAPDSAGSMPRPFSRFAWLAQEQRLFMQRDLSLQAVSA